MVHFGSNDSLEDLSPWALNYADVLLSVVRNVGISVMLSRTFGNDVSYFLSFDRATHTYSLSDEYNTTHPHVPSTINELTMRKRIADLLMQMWQVNSTDFDMVLRDEIDAISRSSYICCEECEKQG